MEGETIKIMNQDLVRLDRFDGSNFTRWQDKVRFLLTALKISTSLIYLGTITGTKGK
ncbi:hypothetical protein CK203_110169 [Vitis vinifera]|uniref:Retrovirus-related Pol polyprotein from transposon TNT 1-94 n=1 Tax=Vitis vinifera TaxID=29760 RepID=A0A438EC71_VITVI|nr:hypothetical protein CK203_110169 [Vitis vinifera]